MQGQGASSGKCPLPGSQAACCLLVVPSRGGESEGSGLFQVPSHWELGLPDMNGKGEHTQTFKSVVADLVIISISDLNTGNSVQHNLF